MTTEHKEKILVVDDEDIIRMGCLKILEESPYKVDSAENGKIGLEKIENDNFDLVLLDLMMPEVDGITVFKFLSEHYPIPTIIFTSKSPETLDDSIQALLLGAFDFIVKPTGLWEEEFPKLKDKLMAKMQ